VTPLKAISLRVREVFRCPTCGATLDRWSPTGLECAGGHGVPVVRGIPRFVSGDHYAGSFSFEWNTHDRTQLDVHRGDQSSEEILRQKTGLTPEAVRGRLVLDAGVGAGRFTDVLSRWGAFVVGVDLSYAVEAAHRNFADRPEVMIAQADIGHLPFAEATFEVIVSIGVLHHTPDARAYFRKLVPLLKPGGRVAIWVYPREGAFVTRSAWIPFTSRIPPRAFYAWCRWFVPRAQRLPSRHLQAFSRMFPFSAQGLGIENDILDTFDGYSPRYHGIHAPAEVEGWFAESGLVDVRHFVSTAVSGVRPVAAGSPAAPGGPAEGAPLGLGDDDGRNRTVLGDRFLAGRGFEIGAGALPSQHPGVRDIVFVDKRDPEGLAALFKAAIPYQVVTPDQAAALCGREGPRDFVIAHHVLEHTPDPIRTMMSWLGLIRDGGRFFVSLPSDTNVCEKDRVPTPIGHLLDDFLFERSGDDYESKGHILSFIDQWTVFDPEEFWYAKRGVLAFAEASLGEMRRGDHDLHWHTYQLPVARQVIEAAAHFTGRAVEWLVATTAGSSHYLVGTVRPAAAPTGLPGFLAAHRALLEGALARLEGRGGPGGTTSRAGGSSPATSPP
jgi:SAM-dependent methyltransferase